MRTNGAKSKATTRAKTAKAKATPKQETAPEAVLNLARKRRKAHSLASKAAPPKHNVIKAEAPASVARTMPAAPARIEARTNASTLEIDVFGAIGGWEGVTATKFKQALDGAGDVSKIVVNINSPGGDVFDGVAIYNMLTSHDAEVETRVYGLAASAASVIAIAGDNVLMGEGSFLMIHNAWTMAVGDSREMAKMSKTLKAIDTELATTYADHTGIDAGEIAEMMDAETWLGSADAVDQGFANGVIETPETAKASYDLSAFRNVPKALLPKRPKRSVAASKPAAIAMPPAENLQPLLAELQRLVNALKT